MRGMRRRGPGPVPHARRVALRAGAALVALAGGVALGGCSTTLNAVDIALRDADSHEPVPGAAVRVVPLYLHVSGAEVLNPSARGGVIGRTGPDGRVRLDVPTDHAFTMTVLGIDFGPVDLTFEHIEEGWQRLHGDAATLERGVEARVTRP